MWIPAQTTVPPGRTARQRHRHELARRGEDDRGVELLGRRLVGASRPLGPERAGERLRGRIIRAREREHPARLRSRHLGDDVRGGTESVQPDALARAREAQRAEADQPGAQQRRRLEVPVALAGSGSRSARRRPTSSA